MTSVGSERKCIPLLREEAATSLMMEPGITTFSFFSGSIQSAKSYFHARLKSILVANPWLAGVIEKDANRNDCIQLTYGSAPIDDSTVDSLFSVSAELNLNRDMTYMELCEASVRTKVLVPDGNTILADRILVSRFVLGNTPEGFVLAASISHCIADGFTYYGILSMLSPNVDVTSLVVERNMDYPEQSSRMVGKEQSSFLYSGALVFNMITKMICGCGKSVISSYFVDTEKVNALKEQAKQENEVPYVSTCDIIASHFASLCRPRVLLYAVNLRKRLPSMLSDKHAGNYESALLLDESTYSKPAQVRRTLASYEDGGMFKHVGAPGAQPLPGFWEKLRCPLGLVTSWLFDSFNGDLSFDDCEMKLHVPVGQDADVTPLDMAIIFRACKDRIGVMYISKKISGAQLLQNGSPLSSEVCV